MCSSDLLNLARVPVYVWDVGSVPFGLRGDAIGAGGRLIADVANRCAVGTSWMKMSVLSRRSSVTDD